MTQDHKDKDLETVIRYLEKDIAAQKERTDKLIHEVNAERNTIRSLYVQLTQAIDGIKSTIFEYVTGKELPRETVYITDQQFQNIVQAFADAGVNVMENREFSTLKCNRFKLVNKAWLREVKKGK